MPALLTATTAPRRTKGNDMSHRMYLESRAREWQARAAHYHKLATHYESAAINSRREGLSPAYSQVSADAARVARSFLDRLLNTQGYR